jgi:5-carboxymethyl-2-hydroxymuconate isomerase
MQGYWHSLTLGVPGCCGLRSNPWFIRRGPDSFWAKAETCIARERNYMPHIVVEYSDTLKMNVPAVLKELHENLAKEESVQLDRIKTRAIPLKNFVIADRGTEGSMVHITLKVMTRPDDVAKRMAVNLQTIVRHHVPADCKVTAEVVELNAATYCA